MISDVVQARCVHNNRFRSLRVGRSDFTTARFTVPSSIEGSGRTVLRPWSTLLLLHPEAIAERQSQVFDAATNPGFIPPAPSCGSGGGADNDGAVLPKGNSSSIRARIRVHEDYVRTVEFIPAAVLDKYRSDRRPPACGDLPGRGTAEPAPKD